MLLFITSDSNNSIHLITHFQQLILKLMQTQFHIRNKQPVETLVMKNLKLSKDLTLANNEQNSEQCFFFLIITTIFFSSFKL